MNTRPHIVSDRITPRAIRFLPRSKNASPLGTPSGLRANASRLRYIVMSTMIGNGSTTKSLTLGVMRGVP